MIAVAVEIKPFRGGRFHFAIDNEHVIVGISPFAIGRGILRVIVANDRCALQVGSEIGPGHIDGGRRFCFPTANEKLQRRECILRRKDDWDEQENDNKIQQNS